jgi:hypothetical protein
MKYLKLFEDIGLYKEVDIDDAFLSHISFTQKEIDKLENFGFKTLGHGKPEEYTGNCELRKLLFYPSKQYTLLRAYEIGMIYLYKLEDEYYVLRYVSTNIPVVGQKFYKCDQLDGLLDCLKKEFNIV